MAYPLELLVALVAPPALGSLSSLVPITGVATNLNAVVTGAARGIGAAIAATLAREGAQVVGIDRPQEEEFGMLMLGEGTPYITKLVPFLSVLGAPCLAPPWATSNSSRRAWRTLSNADARRSCHSGSGTRR